jgi:uncharacterized membrane protein
MPSVKPVFKYLLGAGFMLAGLNHFLNADFYVRIMPPYLPWPKFLVYLSGVFEAALGLLLLLPRLSRLAAWGLIALLIAVFPANLHMALHPELFPEFKPQMLWWRLPFQLVFIAWAYWFTRPDYSAKRTAAERP